MSSEAPARLFIGETRHARLAPFRHAFRYRIASLLVDVDRLTQAGRLSRLFSINRFNLFSFHEKDHGARDGAPLRPWAEDAFARAGVMLDGGRVHLFCFPRILGYVFNPISVWFGHGPEGDLRGVIYEVNNTFGDSHAYVVPIECAAGRIAPHSAEKRLHVSPFFDREGRYRFKLRPPGDTVKLVIHYEREGAPALTATQTATARPLTTATLFRAFATHPLMTLKVISAIHLEALRLVTKGARYHSRPPAGPEFSIARTSLTEGAAT